MKKCNKCFIEKNENEYFKDKTKKDGLSTICKVCREEYGKAYRLEHKGKQKIYLKQYREENKEHLASLNKEWRKNNKEHLQKTKKEYYLGGYKEKQIKSQKKRFLERIKTDVVFRLRVSVSKHVRTALKQRKLKKDHPTWSKLPYTPQQLKEHLERLWEPWMNWDNYRRRLSKQKNLANRSYYSSKQTSI